MFLNLKPMVEDSGIFAFAFKVYRVALEIVIMNMGYTSNVTIFSRDNNVQIFVFGDDICIASY